MRTANYNAGTGLSWMGFFAFCSIFQRTRHCPVRPPERVASIPVLRFALGLILCWGLTALLSKRAWAQQPQLVSGVIDGRPIQGLEIIGALNRQIVLGSDGWIHDFDPRTTQVELKAQAGHFQPLSALAMRQQLVAEFGRDFDVVTTQHFLVVQPKGSSQRWPALFEQLHRTFTAYFSVRGVRVREGNFPMIAIVMPHQAAMQSYLDGLGLSTSASGLLGVYDRASNRIVMYDHGDSSGGIAATICHEAAHQSAFNSGVHSRFADTPHWIIEGVGCLFQSPAMIEGRRNGPRKDRIDPGLLLAYQSTYGHQPKKLSLDLEALVASDQMFKDRANIENAYTAAWALTFYLSEREPSKFAELVRLYGAKPPLEAYTAPVRKSDFLKVCGIDASTMALRVGRFMDQME